MWISFASTSLICSKFFGVSLFWINALSMIYMVVFFAFPIATTIIDRYGLETAARVGVVLNVMGAILRCVGCSHSSLFVVVFVGQTVCGFGQIFMLGVPACLAQTWFPDNEKARATSIAALTNQLGVAAGFLAPVIVTTGDQLLRLQIVFVCLCVASAVATFVWFRAPRFAASISQQIKNTANTAHAEQSNVAAFLRDLRALCGNVQFMLLALLFGCATGLFYAFTTLLDDILHHYVGDEVSAGAVGLCIVAVGLVGAMAAGVLMDRLPHSHVTLCRAASLLYLVAFVWWHAAVVNAWPRAHLFASTIAQGVSVTALLPICFEIGVEMTFPLSESNSASVQLAIGDQKKKSFCFMFLS